MEKSYYDVLELERNATADDIKKAYNLQNNNLCVDTNYFIYFLLRFGK